jgi:large subunit ribosomal protein L23
MTPAQIIRRPIALTEKAAMLKEDNKVIFEVALRANKIEIRKAVEEMFDVDVVEVNTLVQRGKVKRMGRGSAKRPNWKKAIVTLADGDDIQFFDESEATESESESQE